MRPDSIFKYKYVNFRVSWLVSHSLCLAASPSETNPPEPSVLRSPSLPYADAPLPSPSPTGGAPPLPLPVAPPPHPVALTPFPLSGAPSPSCRSSASPPPSDANPRLGSGGGGGPPPSGSEAGDLVAHGYGGAALLPPDPVAACRLSHNNGGGRSGEPEAEQILQARGTASSSGYGLRSVAPPGGESSASPSSGGESRRWRPLAVDCG